MQLIYGLDFTSAPSKSKPIALAEAELLGSTLHIRKLHRFSNFDTWMTFLQRSPEWVAGVDFPLGQPRKLIENLQWGTTWQGYVSHVAQMSKPEFVATLNQYREHRAAGDREHLRQTDKLTGAISPMKVYGVPVGKMFFEGAPRMLKAGFNILPCHPTDDPRTVIEVYPALIARHLLARQSYKSDTKQKQTLTLERSRQDLITQLRSPDFKDSYHFTLDLSDDLALACIQDASGDTLDAILAAIQAAWTSQQVNWSIPETCDRLEGWICGFDSKWIS